MVKDKVTEERNFEGEIHGFHALAGGMKGEVKTKSQATSEVII